MNSRQVKMAVAAGFLAAAVSGALGTVSVDTRRKADAWAAADAPCDTRSFTEDWTVSIVVDTRLPKGTVFLLR